MGYAGEVDGGREVVTGSIGFKDPLLGGEVNNTNLPEIRSFNYEYKLNFRNFHIRNTHGQYCHLYSHLSYNLILNLIPTCEAVNYLMC